MPSANRGSSAATGWWISRARMLQSQPSRHPWFQVPDHPCNIARIHCDHREAEGGRLVAQVSGHQRIPGEKVAVCALAIANVWVVSHRALARVPDPALKLGRRDEPDSVRRLGEEGSDKRGEQAHALGDDRTLSDHASEVVDDHGEPLRPTCQYLLRYLLRGLIEPSLIHGLAHETDQMRLLLRNAAVNVERHATIGVLHLDALSLTQDVCGCRLPCARCTPDPEHSAERVDPLIDPHLCWPSSKRCISTTR